MTPNTKNTAIKNQAPTSSTNRTCRAYGHTLHGVIPDVRFKSAWNLCRSRLVSPSGVTSLSRKVYLWCDIFSALFIYCIQTLSKEKGKAWSCRIYSCYSSVGKDFQIRPWDTWTIHFQREKTRESTPFHNRGQICTNSSLWRTRSHDAQH